MSSCSRGCPPVAFISTRTKMFASVFTHCVRTLSWRIWSNQASLRVSLVFGAVARARTARRRGHAASVGRHAGHGRGVRSKGGGGRRVPFLYLCGSMRRARSRPAPMHKQKRPRNGQGATPARTGRLHCKLAYSTRRHSPRRIAARSGNAPQKGVKGKLFFFPLPCWCWVLLLQSNRVGPGCRL